MSFFKKVTNAEGVEEYVEVELTAADVPEELVKQTDPYKTVLNESVERRKEKAELKKKLDTVLASVAVEAEDGKAEETPVKATEASATVPTLDTEALYKDFRTRLAKEQEEAKTEEEKRQETLKEIAKRNGLGDRVIPILANTRDPEKAAKDIAAARLMFEDVESGEPGVPGDDMWAKIDGKLGTGVKTP